VLHSLVGVRDASRELGVYFGKGGLSFEVDAVVCGVLFCDCDKARVWARNASDCRRAFKS
jgi:hypothetical protein